MRPWTVPPERMKGARVHRVPVAEPALTVLHEAGELRDGSDPGAFVFPGGKSGRALSNMSTAMLLRRLGRGDLTVHGMRSSFRDWCAEATNFSRELAEAALAHTLADKTEAAYRRGDALEKRRALMRDWATFCMRPAPGRRGCAAALNYTPSRHLPCHTASGFLASRGHWGTLNRQP